MFGLLLELIETEIIENSLFHFMFLNASQFLLSCIPGACKSVGGMENFAFYSCEYTTIGSLVYCNCLLISDNAKILLL